MPVDPARVNRRRTLEARRARKLAAAVPLGAFRAKALGKMLTSKYAPNECQAEGKR
jgi:hypothetical protein